MLVQVLRLLRPYWLRGLELLGYMLVDLAYLLAIPLSSKYLFDDIILQGDYSRLGPWVVIVLAIFGLGALASYRRLVIGGLVGELVLCDVQRAMFAHLQQLSLRFHARSRAGDLLARLTNDAETVENTVGGTVPALLFQLLSLLAGTIVLLLLNWMLGLLVLALGLPILIGVYASANDRLRRTSRELQDQFGDLSAFAQENLSGQVVVKTFSLEQWAVYRFQQLVAALFHTSMRLIGIAAVLSGSSNMIFHGIRVLVLAAGAVLIMNGMLSVGELVAFIALVAQVLSPAVNVSDQYQQVQAASGAFDRIHALLSEAPDIVESPHATKLPRLRHEIRLEQVSFQYDQGEAVLRDVSLSIPAGQRVAIVGRSGSGKSTLIGLLLRLYDPSEGRILFDGHDLRDSTLTSLRRQLAVVPQETFLFDASIADNIAIGLEQASAAQVRQAAQAAALHEVIERTEAGYQTMIGERGVRLSGGQRQRLAIARALVRDPSVLILDEATSALDAETEAEIMKTLDQVGRDRTIVMITHRLSSAVRCDTIFVLDQGRLVEQGTHDQLYAQGGLYWWLFTEQQVGRPRDWTPLVEPARLSQMPLLASLSDAEVRELALRLSVERYPAGVDVIRQGESAEKLFLVAEGQVEVMLEADDLPAQRIATLGTSDCFGEIALLDDGARRTATVRTLTPVELYSLHRMDLLHLMQMHPEVADAVGRLARERSEQTRLLAGRARSATQPFEPASEVGHSPR